MREPAPRVGVDDAPHPGYRCRPARERLPSACDELWLLRWQGVLPQSFDRCRHVDDIALRVLQSDKLHARARHGSDACARDLFGTAHCALHSRHSHRRSPALDAGAAH